jgi:hypothetical protein
MSDKSNQNVITDLFRKTSETPTAEPIGSKRSAESSASTTSLRVVSEVTESSKRARSSLSSATARKWLQESPVLQEWLHFTEKVWKRFFVKLALSLKVTLKTCAALMTNTLKALQTTENHLHMSMQNLKIIW